MSETGNLKLKKHDNPETSEEKFDVDNYLNGNWDKIDENAKKTNNQILQLETEKAKLEKELKEAQEDIYQNSIRGQASGEYIHVEDSSNCRAKIGIGGNSEQETREGYNLLSASEQYTYTSGNVKLASDGAGKYTMNGDGTAQTETIKYSFELEKEYTIKNNDYLHIMNNGTVTSNAIIILLDSNKSGVVSYDFTTNNKIENLSNYAGKTIKYIQLYMNPIKVDITLTPMIINNVSTAKSFEAYGAMPSTDYPSEIKTVGSNANLIEETFEGYNINANGAFEKLNGFDIQIVKVKANVKYTLNTNTNLLGYYNEKPTTSSITYDKSRTVLSSLTNVIIPSKTGYIAIRTSNTAKVKLVEGTEVGEYSKHGQGCVKVTKCNKNIWNLGNKGNNSGDISFPLKSGKYTLSFKKKRISNSTITNAWVYRYAYIRFYDKNDTLLSSIKDGMAINLTANQTSDRQIIDFTAPENTVKMIVNFSNNNGDNNNNTESIEIQLEGEKATSFEQHQEQSYIMPVQKEMLEGDYFDWDNEEEVHVWGNVIVNGTETINKNSNSEFFSITKSMSQFDTSANAIKQSRSNYGAGTTLGLGSGNTNNKYSFNASTIYLDCYNSNINTVEKLKVQLTKNNMKIYAKLATPTRLKFTDEQKAVAKELNNARTYKNVTNITTDSIAILDLDYAKDLETLLNNTQALAVNNASEGV